MNKLAQEPAKFPTAFDHALNAGNIEDLLSLYDEQATIRTSDDRVEQGYPAIRLEMEKLIDAKAELVNQTRHTFQSGDTALIVVDWTLTLSTPEGQQIHQSGTATNVLKHDSQRGWRMIVANPQGTL